MTTAPDRTTVARAAAVAPADAGQRVCEQQPAALTTAP